MQIIQLQIKVVSNRREAIDIPQRVSLTRRRDWQGGGNRQLLQQFDHTDDEGSDGQGQRSPASPPMKTKIEVMEKALRPASYHIEN